MINREDVDGDGGGEMSVYVMNSDGANPHRISPALDRAAEPVWSNDGKIFFNYLDGGVQGIASINSDGTEFKKITEEFSGYLSGRPAVSPNRKQIAYASFDGNYEIYIANSDGTNKRNLTNNPSTDIQPVWAPDGKNIFFVSHRNGGAQIYSENLESGTINLITNESVSYDPAISADGKKLAFTSERDNWYNIYVQDLSSGKFDRITFSGANRYPAFKPK